MTNGACTDESRHLKRAVADLEKRLIYEALEATDWIKARAARRLGITQRILGYKIKKYGIKRQGYSTVNREEKGGER